MFWEALGSALVGLALAWAATRWMPSRLPHPRLVLPTGAGGGLVGGMVAYAVMGPGNLLGAMVIAAGVAVAMLSLLCGHAGHAPQQPAGVAPRAAAPRPH